MTLYFITGNEKKFKEVKAILGDVEQIEIDLPEVQGIDAEKIVKEKLNEAFKHKDAEFVVEDTSLYMDCLKGLPGPLIRYFLETIGNQGLYDIAESFNNHGTEAKTIVGYAKSKDEIYFFEGSMRGQIVPPTAESKFGWDNIFKPNNHNKCYAELTFEEKNAVSMRNMAFTKLKEFLKK